MFLQSGGAVSRSFSWVRRNVSPIAVDFGTRVIRMLQLANYRGQPSIIACSERALPPGTHSSADYEQMRCEAVKEMLAEDSFIGREAATAVRWDDLQIRNLRIPQMPEEEIGNVIRFEAAERFALSPSDAEIRFLLAGDVRQGTEVRQEVIAMGVGGQTINAHITMLSRLGLQPVAIDAGPCAMFRPFERFLRRDEDANAVNAFVDMGYTATRVVVSRGPNLIFYKAIPIGGRRYDELLSQQLDLSLADAAQLRIRLHRQHVADLTGQPHQLTDDEVVNEDTQRAVIDALRPALEQLSKEIGLCLRYCSVTFRGIRSEAVTAIGGDACNRDVLRVLSDQVNVPFNVGKPMRNIGADAEFGGSERRTGQPEWATALGLALKRVSLEAGVAS